MFGMSPGQTAAVLIIGIIAVVICYAIYWS